MRLHGIDLDQDAIRAFCSKWKIHDLRVFGSILRDDFRDESDVDFLAEFDETVERDVFDHMDMEDELAAIIGRSVDLVERSAVEASGNRFYIRSILDAAEPVLAKQ